jgi:diguanylate cyclase (GGDEF)-like protein/PAS domain S-box-containing protein
MSETISTLLFFTGLLQLLLSMFALSRRDEPAARPLTVTFLIGAIWAIAYGIDIASSDINTKIHWMLVRLSFNRFLSLAALWIAFEHLEIAHKLKKWTPLLHTAPILALLLIWTSNFHQLYRYDYELKTIGELTILTWKNGPANWLFYGFDIALYAVALYQLITSLGDASQPKRRQTILIVISLFAPLLTDIFFKMGFSLLPGINLTSFFMLVSEALIVYAIFRYGWMKIIPMARSTLTDVLPGGMIAVDAQNRIVDVNRFAQELLDLPMKAIIGKDFHKTIAAKNIKATIELGRSQVRREIQVERSDHSIHYFDVSITPLKDRTGKHRGHLIYFNNITSQKKEELRLIQLSQAVEQSPASVVVTDLQGNIIYVNPQFTQLTGYSREEAIGKNPNIVQSGQTPDRTYKEMWMAIEAGQTWRGEFLNKKKNGELYWEMIVIAPAQDHNGNTVNYIAVKQDITVQKQTEAALRFSEERFRQLVMSAPDAVFGIDAQGNIIFANKEATNLLGYENDELLGQNVELLVPETLRVKHTMLRGGYFIQPRTRTMGAGQELLARHKNGSGISVGINLSHSMTENGPLVIAFMRDITDAKKAKDALQQANQQMEKQIHEIEKLQAILREQAIRDPLTQLHNRRYLDESIEHEFHYAVRHSLPLSIIMLDIDHFKRVNDTYGHYAGDACLISLAQLLQQSIRKSDIVCRYGGEEFLLLLPNSDARAAMTLAEKIRHTFEGTVNVFNGQEIRNTISLGIASFPEHGATYNEIIEKADKALYISKRSGRNRSTAWQDALTPVE